MRYSRSIYSFPSDSIDRYPYNDSIMQTLNKLPRIASIVAFVIAGFTSLAALVGPIVVLPITIIPLCAGIGILRKRVWSAYGFATYLFAQLLLLPIILLRPGYSIGHVIKLFLEAFIYLLLGILFLSAGRSLSASGAARGRAFPWIVVAALSIAPFFFVQTFKIPGGAMETTLLPGDSILATTFPPHPPERGNLLLFLSPQDRSLVLIKRVIAVPGDHIRISRKIVILNGNALDEKYVMNKSGEEEPYLDDIPNDSSFQGCAEGHEMLSQHVMNGEIVVPAGEYFVLGDNRENSLDSRCWGFVSTGDLIGKPLMIYDSVDQTEEEAWSPHLQWVWQTRWSRLFTVF
jgi:signal peptidase I